MLTPLISSQFVTPFKFWHEGRIQTGMQFRNELFQSVAEFALIQRQKAFELAWQLAQQHDDEAIVMTASATHYCVWMKIRSRDRCLAC
ncbi:hypothetical protein H6F67_12960 [Microcoleus sp. FACHB-1515]|uniref:hypothetical protein n=1 Tax=Cyanophyceae TaxID=3028117 RepID=UPI001682D3C3|nr:hypothetical protein [Microcoleus sp. FACHB-1515]MBD2090764.1 hypothetical protein [Microcoleus sp. FACHB-1515]